MEWATIHREKMVFLFHFRVAICCLSGIWILMMKCFHFHMPARFGRKFNCMKEMQIPDWNGKVWKRTLLLGVWIDLTSIDVLPFTVEYWTFLHRERMYFFKDSCLHVNDVCQKNQLFFKVFLLALHLRSVCKVNYLFDLQTMNNSVWVKVRWICPNAFCLPTK